MSMQFQADLAPTRFVDGPQGETFAYRRLGTPSNTPPLVLLLRLRGTIDHWDPAFLDAVAAEREVIIFDNRGLNASTGTPASSLPELVDGAIAFINALGLKQVDLLCWSLGGIVAQGVALTAPGLVRRLIVAGSTPGGVPDAPSLTEKVLGIVSKPVNDAEDFLYLSGGENRDFEVADYPRLGKRMVRIGERADIYPVDAVEAMQGAEKL